MWCGKMNCKTTGTPIAVNYQMVTMTHQMACRLLKSITVAVQMVLPHPIQYIFLRTSLLSCLSPVVICVRK